MATLTFSSELSTPFGSMSINTGKGKYSVIEEQILGFSEQLSAFLSYHNKALVAAVTVTQLPTEIATDNQSFSAWLKQMLRRLSRQLKLNRIAYGWFRERSASAKPHYHLVLVVDGSRYRSHYSLAARIRENNPSNAAFTPTYATGNLVRRNDRRSVEVVIYWISYFCKSRSKTLDPGIRKFGLSRLKPRPVINRGKTDKRGLKK